MEKITWITDSVGKIDMTNGRGGQRTYSSINDVVADLDSLEKELEKELKDIREVRDEFKSGNPRKSRR